MGKLFLAGSLAGSCSDIAANRGAIVGASCRHGRISISGDKRMCNKIDPTGWNWSLLLLFLLAVSCNSPEHRLNREGVQLARAGEYQQALRKFQAASDAAPEWVEIQLNLARTYLLLNQPQAALAPAKAATQLMPDSLEGQLILAQTYLLLKQKPKAEKILQQLTKRYPKNPFLFMALGDLALAARDWDQAITYYRRSLELDNRSDRANLNLGRAYLYKEISNFRADRPVALPQTKDPRSMMARAGQLISSGGIDLERSRVCFRQAVYLNPQNSQAHLMLGLLAFYTASYREAEMELAQALKQEPDNGFLHMALALNAQKLGKLEQAASHLQQAVKLMPDKLEPRIIQIFVEIERQNYSPALEKIKK